VRHDEHREASSRRTGRGRRRCPYP
jgi:hypothetical protein